VLRSQQKTEGEGTGPGFKKHWGCVARENHKKVRLERVCRPTFPRKDQRNMQRRCQVIRPTTPGMGLIPRGVPKKKTFKNEGPSQKLKLGTQRKKKCGPKSTIAHSITPWRRGGLEKVGKMGGNVFTNILKGGGADRPLSTPLRGVYQKLQRKGKCRKEKKNSTKK